MFDDNEIAIPADSITAVSDFASRRGQHGGTLRGTDFHPVTGLVVVTAELFDQFPFERPYEISLAFCAAKSMRWDFHR